MEREMFLRGVQLPSRGSWLEELVGEELELGADALPNLFTMERIYDIYVADAA
jgi:hypothetical protein